MLLDTRGREKTTKIYDTSLCHRTTHKCKICIFSKQEIGRTKQAKQTEVHPLPECLKYINHSHINGRKYERHIVIPQ